MGPLTTFLIVVGIVALAGVAIGYAVFCFSAPKRWRDAVMHVNLDAQQRRRKEERAWRNLNDRLADDLRAVSERGFRDMLRRIEVEELKAFPGIGDVIVERLRGAGLRSLADLQYRLPEIPSIGEKRVADIRHAVRELTQQADKVFASNMCAEAAAAADESRRLKQQRDASASAIQETIQSLDNYLCSIASVVNRARQITFLRYLWSLVARDRSFDVELPPVPSGWTPMTQAFPAAKEPVLVVQRAATRAPAVASIAPATPEKPERRRIPEMVPAAPALGKLVSVSPARPRSSLPQKTAPVDELTLDGAAPVARAASLEQKPKDRHLLLMELTIQFLFAAARCDGHIARKEREVIDEQIRRQYGHDPALFNRARSFCAEFESEAIDLDECYRKITENFTAPDRCLLMKVATQIAEASRGINAREDAFLDKAAKLLGVPRPPVTASAPPPQIKPAAAQESAQPPPPTETPATQAAPPVPVDPRTLLEIDSGLTLSAELVRRQYNLLIERFDEDKIKAMGQEFAAMAAKKRAALEDAAKRLLASLGAEPDLAPPAPAAHGLRDNPDLDQIFGA
jgi:uncharacterized tellurite resistance protein B-like protein